MAKLAEYMAYFAALLGQEHAVHFDHLEKGSTKIVSRVEFEDVPKVITRLTEIRNRTAPKELARLVTQIDDRLANDNAIGRVLIDEGERGVTAELLAFPAGTGRKLKLTARSIRKATLTVCCFQSSGEMKP